MDEVNLSDVKMASYNPRRISQESYEKLKESLRTLGVVKPILVNRANNVLIAGHQRTKAMREIGLQKCMCFFLNGVNQNDERRFNQYHNKCEYEINPDAPKIKINQKLQLGINEIERENVIVQDKGRLAELNKILSVLCLRYGEFGLPIADIEGTSMCHQHTC